MPYHPLLYFICIVLWENVFLTFAFNFLLNIFSFIWQHWNPIKKIIKWQKRVFVFTSFPSFRTICYTSHKYYKPNIKITFTKILVKMYMRVLLIRLLYLFVWLKNVMESICGPVSSLSSFPFIPQMLKWFLSHSNSHKNLLLLLYIIGLSVKMSAKRLSIKTGI